MALFRAGPGLERSHPIRYLLCALLVFLLGPPNLQAQHPNWLEEGIQVDDPGELAYWMAVGADCPLTQAEVGELVESVLARNRIRPVRDEALENDRVYLNVNLRCTQLSTGDQYAYSLDIHFGRYQPLPAILFDAPFSDYGVGDKARISRACTERVKAAVAIFMKANRLTIGSRPVFIARSV